MLPRKRVAPNGPAPAGGGPQTTREYDEPVERRAAIVAIGSPLPPSRKPEMRSITRTDRVDQAIREHPSGEGVPTKEDEEGTGPVAEEAHVPELGPQLLAQ